MTDLDDVVAGARARLADLLAVDADAPVLRRHRPPVVLLAVAVLLLVVAVVVVIGDDDADQADHVAAGVEPSLDNADLLAVGADEPLPAPPTDGRLGVVSVWTGQELLVWGGTAIPDPSTDGAAYDPRTETWRTLAPSPLSARSSPASVWTGTEWVLWGGAVDRGAQLLPGGVESEPEPLADGAAYDPATDTWRPIAAPPFDGVTRTATVWTGREMIVLGDLDGPPRAAAYDPAADSWRVLDPPPGSYAPDDDRGVWTGEEAVFTVTPDRLTGPLIFAAFDPDTGVWRQLPPLDVRTAALFSVDGAVIAVTRFHPASASILDPDATEWRPLAALPIPYGSADALLAPAGDHAIIWRPRDTAADLLYLDLRTGAFTVTETARLPFNGGSGDAVWADGVVLACCGLDWSSGINGPPAGIIARPTPTDGVIPAPPDALPTTTTPPPG